MRIFLLFYTLALVDCQVYKAVTATKERKSILGPFTVPNQAACELACNCARGDASGQACAQFSGVIKTVNCLIYYYTASWCSFLGDYTVNTCILPIVEYKLQQVVRITTLSLDLTTFSTTETPTTTTTLLTTTGTTEQPTTEMSGWSEWVTTGVCPTTCGSCSNATRTRTCKISPCEGGVSADLGPCGISLCVFPVKSCCRPYAKSLNYRTGKFFCGTDNVY